MRFHFAFACALAVALTLRSGPLLADPSPTELAVARRLFEEASELEGQQRWKDAQGKLAEALAIKETPGLRFHLGYCFEQLGQLVAAQIEYERALDLIRGGAKAPDVQRLAEPAVARVQARVAQLTLRLPADAAGADVSLDGRKLAPGVIGRPAPIDPGRHQLRVTASENRVANLELELREGEQRTLHVVLRRPTQGAGPTPAPAAPSAAPQKAPEQKAASSAKANPKATAAAPADSAGIGTREIVLIGEASAALVGLGVGIGYMIVRGDARERVEAAQAELPSSNDACAGMVTPPACDDLSVALEDYDRAGVISTIGFVGAGVAGAATALTFVLWKPEKRPALSLGPGPGGPGLTLGSRF